MKETFGEFLLRVRGRRTRKEVAEQAAISAEYLRQIEHQGKIPKEDKLIALAKALGLDSKEILTRALRERNQEAARTILSIEPRFPQMRKVLLSKLAGPETGVVVEDLQGLALGPHERSAILFWGCVFFMDKESLDEKEARLRAKEEIGAREFVEERLARYVVRYLVSWQVDPETGIQSHFTEEPRINKLLRLVGEYLGHLSGSEKHQRDDAAEAFSELLNEPEFVSLYRNLKKYASLNDRDKLDIRAWWKLVNRMVEEKLDPS